jgi:PKD repeat protein
MKKMNIQSKASVSKIFFALIGIASVLFFVQCKKDPFKSWTFYVDAAPPLEIVSVNSIIKDCEPPYPVTYNQETKNLLGTVTYFWDFGDGNTSTDQNPTHIYQVPGDYSVMFVVSNEISSDTAYLSMPELALSSIPVVSSYTYRHYNNNTWAPNKVIYTNTSSGANQFYWYFGDGEEGDSHSPEHVFQNSGTYNVRLRGTCTNGTYHEVTQQISISPAPTRVFIDSINLMLPSSFKGAPIFIELWHNSSYVGATSVRSPSSFPVKFKRPSDFPGAYFFDYVQFSAAESFKFIVYRHMGSENPPEFLREFSYSPYALQNEFYPRAVYQIEIPPFDPTDNFIDLYLSY